VFSSLFLGRPFRCKSDSVLRAFWVVLVLAALTIAPSALAQNAKIEQQVRALQKKAMEEDYLTTEFGKADEKLTKAVNLCAVDKCSARIRAALRRDLGVVQIGGQLDRDKGIKYFIDALKVDPTIQLDPDFKTKEIEQAFDGARQVLSGGGPPPGPGPATGGDAAPAGDFVHTPVAEQTIRTAVPIYVEYSGPNQLVKVTAQYKSLGMNDWRTIELKKMGQGWGGNVPCGDVQEGTFQYFLRGYNAQDDAVATAGGPNNTYKVPIIEQLEGSPPRLPGQAAPKQCPPECTPGAPCVSKEELRPEGDACEEGAQCRSNECNAGRCTAPAPSSKYPRFWFGVGATVDFVLLPGANDVCKLNSDSTKSNFRQPKNDAGYYCAFNGTDYPDRERGLVENGNLQDGKAGSVTGGVTMGNIRLYVSFDYALSKNFLIGLRAGLILRRFPGQQQNFDGRVTVPVHAEVRLTYLLGKDAIQLPMAPYFFLAGGAAEYTAGVEVPVVQTGLSGNKLVDAWSIAGPAFAAAGGGVRFSFGDRRNAGLLAGARFNLTLPLVGSPVIPSVGPEVAAQLGF
jgi:hypothetical protein